MQRLNQLIPPLVYAQLNELRQMQKLVARSIPEKLGNHAQVTGIENLTLTITADTQSWANNLRYAQQQIIDALNASTDKDGWRIKIRIKSASVNGFVIEPQSRPAEDHTTDPINERVRLRNLLKRI